MIQLLIRKVVVLAYNKWLYPHMTTSNFKTIWTLLINQLSSLPLRMIISTGLDLFNKNKGLRVLTAERILKPILENSGITKVQVKESKPDNLVRTIYLFTTFSRFVKVSYKWIIWLPKLVLTLTFLSLANVDVTSLFNILSNITYGTSDLIKIIIDTIIKIIMLTVQTGEIKDYFQIGLNSISNMTDNIPFYSGDNSEKILTSDETWKSKQFWSALGFLVITLGMNYLSEMEGMHEWLENHSWVNKVFGFFKGVYKFGSDLNNVFKDNIPFVGSIESMITSVVKGTYSLVLATGSTLIVTPIKGVYNAGSTVLDYTVVKPVKWLKSWFISDSISKKDFDRLTQEMRETREDIQRLRSEDVGVVKIKTPLDRLKGIWPWGSPISRGSTAGEMFGEEANHWLDDDKENVKVGSSSTENKLNSINRTIGNTTPTQDGINHQSPFIVEVIEPSSEDEAASINKPISRREMSRDNLTPPKTKNGRVLEGSKYFKAKNQVVNNEEPISGYGDSFNV